MKEGETYRIYVDSKHPATFVYSKRIKVSSIVIAVLGIFFFRAGVTTFYVVLPYFLKMIN